MKDIGVQVIDNNDEGAILDLKIEPKYDANGKIVSGLVIGNTLEQNKSFILMARPGDFKFSPSVGVGILDAVLDTEENLLQYRHRIREHFQKDGLKVNSLDFYSKNTLKIDAEYS